jgi:L-histidine N-alpha-methyltransferase
MKSSAQPQRAPSDRAPAAAFLQDVLAGLGRSPKQLSAKWFYDARGAELFDRICELEEYEVTRTELELLEEHGAAMAASLGTAVQLIELGSGSGAKTRALLDRAPNVRSYTPIDVCGPQLAANAAELRRRYPDLEVLPLCADYTAELELPRSAQPGLVRAVSFPGSTIGNLRPLAARALLGRLARWLGRDGRLLIGIDLLKPVPRMIAAYDDRRGVTSAFNRNLLVRMARELPCDVDPQRFRHQARWNPARQCIEMHLVATEPQTVTVAGREFVFEAGESIHTEDSHKYTVEGFLELAEAFRAEQTWVDGKRRFALLCLAARG